MFPIWWLTRWSACWDRLSRRLLWRAEPVRLMRRNLGTMKINHEIDALQVMNLDPVCVFGSAAGAGNDADDTAVDHCGLCLGAARIGDCDSFTWIPDGYLHHRISSRILTVPDVLVGLVKAVVYGAMMGMVGCLRGLQTKSGPVPSASRRPVRL